MKKVIVLIVLLGLGGFLQANIPGDIDSSGCVDMMDISIFSAAWLSDDSPSANWNPACDIPDANDGIVNGLDLAILADHWLLTAPDSNEMAFIPGGQFLMGDSLGDSHDPDPNLSDELPVHLVGLDAFYIGKYEVTNGQYCDFLNAAYESSAIYISDNVVYGSDNDKRYCKTAATSSSLIDFSDGVFSVNMKDGRDMSEDPVIFVSWYGAAAYCNWRSEQDGYQVCYDANDPNWPCDFSARGYRLPTEAQWEYAARGGQHDPYYRFPWGDSIDGSMANYADSGDPYETGTSPETTPAGYYDGNQTPTGSDMSNGYGLYDIAGNAIEWCNDWYDENYYDNSPYDDPIGPDPETMRIIRGGTFSLGSDSCRVANRDRWFPNVPRADSGFRMCLNLN